MRTEHFKLFEYITPGYLPLWVIHSPPGCHQKEQFHDHDFTEISILIGGQATHVGENGSHPVRPGDVLLQHPGNVHTYRDGSSMELINIIFDSRKLPLLLMDAYSMPLIRLFFPATPPPRNNLLPILHLNEFELQAVSAAGFRLRNALNSVIPGHDCDSLLQFLELILYLARLSDYQMPSHSNFSQLEDTLSFISNNFRDQISVAGLAAKARMSERSFFRHFKTVTGYTPNDYLARIRLKYASEQLLFSSKSITEIALDTGFYDSSDFCRKFKKVYNVSPRRFRENTGRSASAKT